MYLYSRNDELYHYGVLGMKWGVRRANRLQSKSKAARAKGDTERANKLAAKSKAIQQKHERRVGGKESYKYSANESVGKSLVKSMLMGTYGTLKYNEARAKGKTQGEAAVNGMLFGIADGMTGNVLRIVEPRLRK